MNGPHVEETIRRILDRRRQNVPGLCPDANELAAFLEDRLTPAEKTAFEAHTADCARCQEALALALQIATDGELGAAPAVSMPRSFAYRSSPLRLVFAAAVVVVVGVLLFQATRQSQPPLEKPRAAVRQGPGDISGGPDAALRPREPRGSSAEAPTASIAMSAGKPGGEPARTKSSQPPAMPSPVAPPAPAVAQVGPATGQLARPRIFTDAGSPKFALSETAKATLPQQTIRGVDDKASQREMAAGRFEEARTKADVANQPAVQIPQQVNVGNLQNVPLNRQVATDQLNVAKAQNAANESGRAGAAALPATEEKKRAEPEQKALSGQTAGIVSQAQDKRMLALPMNALLKGNPASPALEEVRPLLRSDPGGETAKKIGQRLFYRTPNYWVDSSCLAHSEAVTREITRDSKEFADLLAREPGLAQLQAPFVPILLFWNGANYLIR